MTWAKSDNAGLPIWRGQDSMWNIHYPRKKPVLICGGLLIAIYLLCAIGGGGSDRVQQGFRAIFAILILAPGVIALIFGIGLGKEWMGSPWTLTARPDGLAFSGAESWAVPFDAVARVEVGRTADYTPSRKYAYAVEAVPQDEWQVFLFIANGTRRVIHRAHADRDGCSELAASIRGWLESTRSAPIAAASGAAHSAGAEPLDDVFTI